MKTPVRAKLAQEIKLSMEIQLGIAQLQTMVLATHKRIAKLRKKLTNETK